MFASVAFLSIHERLIEVDLDVFCAVLGFLVIYLGAFLETVDDFSYFAVFFAI